MECSIKIDSDTNSHTGIGRKSHGGFPAICGAHKCARSVPTRGSGCMHKFCCANLENDHCNISTI